MENKKKFYIPAEFRLEMIELEESFASGSARLLPGSEQAPYTPELDDWRVEGRTESEFEF